MSERRGGNLPHFRPEQWEPLGRLVKTTANATAAKKIAALDLRRPMRFTGHLFFDGSHKPCTGTTPNGRSRRISALEIHPVYAIEVCINTSLSGCPRTDASKWQHLHKWLEALEGEEGIRSRAPAWPCLTVPDGEMVKGDEAFTRPSCRKIRNTGPYFLFLRQRVRRLSPHFTNHRHLPVTILVRAVC